MFGSAKQFLLDEDRGVSPVIGVILMVAITVILAAVIATFVMNMGPPKDQAPTASFEFSGGTGSGTVTVTHSGGESVAPAELTVKVTSGTGSVGTWTNPSGDISAGDSVEVTSVNSNTVIEVIWNSQQTDKSDVLATWSA